MVFLLSRLVDVDTYVGTGLVWVDRYCASMFGVAELCRVMFVGEIWVFEKSENLARIRMSQDSSLIVQSLLFWAFTVVYGASRHVSAENFFFLIDLSDLDANERC